MADLTAHLWDLARATRQPTDFDQELNEVVEQVRLLLGAGPLAGTGG